MSFSDGSCSRAKPPYRLPRKSASTRSSTGSYPTDRGCALGVLDDGKVVYERGYGLANLEHGVPITSKTVFRIGSVSKQFAAFAILLAEQEGALTLDDDVRDHVPELPDLGETITIRHLIHHTSGLRDYLVLMGLRGLRDEDFYNRGGHRRGPLDAGAGQLPAGERVPLQQHRLLPALGDREARDRRVPWTPSRAAPSSTPLEMSATHFHDDFRAIVPNRASGYEPTEEGGLRASDTTLNMVGDGGIYTSIDELVAWDPELLHGRGRRAPRSPSAGSRRVR